MRATSNPPAPAATARGAVLLVHRSLIATPWSGPTGAGARPSEICPARARAGWPRRIHPYRGTAPRQAAASRAVGLRSGRSDAGGDTPDQRFFPAGEGRAVGASVTDGARAMTALGQRTWTAS